MKTNYCRLKPSNIPNAGVGVFSIDTIPANTNPFPDCTEKLRLMSNDEFSNLTEDKKKMVRDFCYHSSGHWRVPQDFNKLDISWYVNSDINPNLQFNTETGTYITLREIKPGEELTYDYLVYE